MKIHPPQPDEYAAFYAGYVARIGNDDVIDVLHTQADLLRQLLADASDDQARTRPTPTEWSITLKVCARCIWDIDRLRFERVWAGFVPRVCAGGEKADR